MNICQSFLDSFIGGISYFRFVCFEKGSDFYYLFRERIEDIEISEAGLVILSIPFPQNRFIEGKWCDHPTGREFHEFLKNGEDLPRGKIISPGIVYFKIDEVAEAVLYAPEIGEPDYHFEHFPVGYENFANTMIANLLIG